MTKNEFLKELNKKLSTISNKDREKAISFYQELFDDELENGKNEEEIIENLGNPAIISEKIKSELSQKEKDDNLEIKAEKQNKAGTIIAIVLGFPIWFSLLIAVLSVIFSLFISIYSILFALFTSAIAIGISCIVHIFASIFYFSISTTYAFGILGMGFAGLGVSILLWIATVYLTKVVAKFTKWFCKITKKLIKATLGGNK